MADDEEIEEYEYYEETIIEDGDTVEYEPKAEEPVGPSEQPVKKRIRKKVDTSKFMTPYIAHSKKMQDMFSQNKYKEKYEKHRGEPYASTTDTPELRRIKKVQNQLSEVKYRMDGNVARTNCHVDEKARDIEHAKKVSQQVSKVLYKQNWEDTKEKYLLPPDAPELVQAVKNTSMFSKKLYTADWDEDKSTFFPYSDSPELKRVAHAQKALSDINYKKGYNERQLQFTSLADRPDIEMAKKVSQQLSDIKYREDYQKKVKGKWSQTPCYEIAVARMNADNLSDRKYTEDFENVKDQIYFMQTDTPEYKANKKARLNASTVQYKADYEKAKGPTAYHTLPATENPLLRQLKLAGRSLSDILYKESYEKAKGTSINYCDTPKFQIDHVLKDYSDLKYKDHYNRNILGHYIGTYEDPYLTHCAKVANFKSDKNYRADYEEDKTNCYFPQTLTQEYDAVKKLDQCKDYVYKKHPDKIKYTQVADSPGMLQAQVNSKQLSDLNYKSKHEKEKFKCHIPADSPFILQSRLNAYNLSDKWYKYDWEKQKAKKFDIKIDAIPLVAAKANRRKASDVAYKKDYELNKGKMIGALSIHDDPKMLHSVKVAHNQSDIEYKKDYEKLKTKYSTPLDMVAVTSAKKAQAIASNIDYKHPIHSYFYPPDSVSVALAKKAYTIQSDIDYKSDYNSWVKGCGWIPYGSVDEEKVKKAGQILNERKYRQHPDTIKFTSVEDDPVMVQSKINQKQRSDILYKAADEKRIHTYSLPADIPEFIQARVNAYNLSDNYYKQGLEELKAKGYDLKSDAISIRAAKAARKAASDVQYKKAYEDQKGKLVGFRSLQDDPKLVHYMHVAKIQSEREYKKDYEKTKTKYNTPLDMVNVVSAKKAQDIASGIHYKQPIHHYTYLPDAMSVELSKKMMEIQSDNLYKSDLGWLRGTGWIPLGSMDVEKVKKAGAALDEKKYRQHPDTIKFTSVADTPVMVQAKTNALQLSDRLYKSSGEKILHTYHLPPDVPHFIQARCNAANISETNYKQDWLKTIKKGHHVLGDAISIVAAKASNNIASDYKYKQAYEKARGKHVGFRSLQDDPKLVHFMAVAKMQSEREYKKDYEQTKTKYHTPLDMVSISAAKKSQEVATNINYKHPIHHYTFLPDAISVERSRNMMQIQSDNVYKQDYNSWFKGVGWIPLGSLEVEKVKKAGNALSEKKYRQHPDTLKFTSIPDSIEMALAQYNTKQRSDITYKADGEKVKHKYNLNPDDPNFIQARVNAYNISESSYKADWIKHLAKGYDLKPDAISVVAAKASRNIASDYKYKQAYEKDKGKQVGFRSLQDDPKLVHYMHVAKIQSDREYKKDYEKTKLKYHTPVNMVSITAAKKAQEASTNINYKQLIHNYTLLPDAVSLERSKNMMQIQSDNLYKTDFNNWLKGVGWVPIGSLDVEKAKKAKDILSEKKYRQNPDQWKFSIPNDAMDQVLAKHNAQTMNKRLYIDAWEKDKTKIHVMPDTPEIVLSKANQINMSDKLYRSGYEEDKKKGYDLKPDAISIKAARASRDIASDYKYKQAYEKTRGKHIGFRSLQDDPKLVHFMQVAKMQSEREYKKGYEKSKTKFHTPVDMFSVTAAKLAQNVATNTNYKHLIHHYNLLPDAMQLQLSRNRMQIQSDNVYKSDYNDFVKGVGWIPYGSQEAEKNRKSMDILSEKKYRQHPDTFRFTSVPDSMPMVLAKSNAQIMDHNLYTQAWNKDKTTIHVMPDAPEFLLAKANAVNISEKKYRQALEDSKKKGYDLRGDAISIKAAKASRDIASDYKYKKSYEMDKGKMVGFRNLQDDPKLVHFMNVAKMQSDREYHKEYEKTKTKYHTPVTMFSVMAAKEAQEKASNVNYKRLLHKYILLPDAMPLQLAKNMNQIQSDNEYKVDYKTWYKGMGWSPLGSLDVEKSRKATEIASDNKYRQHPSQFKFTRSTDSMDLELAKQNAQVMNRRAYIDAWEKDKRTIHVMPDTPEILLAKQNKTTYSQKQYRQGWEEAIKQGYDLRPDAISIKAAKASRDIASDYKYKTAYRKQQGHHVGFRSLQDDPKSVWAMHVAKIQSDREYKKDYDKWRTKFNTPVDMLGILLAKKCQTLVSDIDYKRMLHNWTCLPDQTAFVQARKVYDIQSDINYKADYNEFMKGVGWIPYGSQEAEKNRKAMDILSDKKYRQHPDRIKFTSVPDSMELVLAKNNAEIMNKKRYIEAWEKDKREIHIMPDTPDILLAKANLINTSDKIYKAGYEEIKKKGYDLKVDAISIKAAKASRDIASDYKYKAAYRKQQGHHVGFRSLQDDPKSVWAMHIAKIQSEREYKKDYEKWRHHFNTPVDMLGILLAKKCQTLVSDIDYKHLLHKWTCLPDQNDVVQARKTYDIQSDNLYKSDLQWLKGVGWSPSGSLEEEKNKRASLILSEKKYRQHPDKFRFKSIPDSLEMVLAKSNADIMNKRLYTDAWNKDKIKIHLMPDTPEVLLAKQNKINFSEKLYKQAMEDDKQKGYDLRADAISIKAARASRDIASDYKYKTGYRKQLGHHVGFKNLQDDPKSVWAMHIAKIQSDREYKKEFEKSKTKYNSPVEMLSVLLAKNCQKLVSDIDYRHYLHQWTCLPDQNDVIQARKAYDLQSDALYKSDLEWLKGIGWVPVGSLEVQKVKKAGEILSDKLYRQKPDKFRFTSIPDSMELVLAKNNALQLNNKLYIDAWEKDKQTIHVMPDTPEILLAKANSVNISNKLYTQGWEDAKAKAYDIRADSIAIKSARASRDIASDYKYKTGYRKQLGHHVGFKSLQDDPKSVWAMHIAKIQSDRVYKKEFEKSKTKYNSPVEMLSVLLAKNCQKLVSDIDYRHYLHQWTCLPDQNDVIQARKAYNLQSDWLYKSDMEWIRGCGWIPNDSLEVNKVKKAQEILSEKSYRQHPDSIKFTSVVDLPSIVLAKSNAHQLSDSIYRDAWEKEKTKFSLPSDTPQMVQSKINAVTISNKLYQQAWEDVKSKGYDLKADAISIKSARASRDIASDYKYKTGYRKQQGHHVGFKSLQDDPKSVWAIHVAKIQSDRVYKKEFEKLKTKYNSPVEMLSVLLAKNCQKLVSDIDYRHYLHQWTCLPDQNDVIQARKAYNLQSDWLYKSDMEWIRGCGWIPNDSLEVNKVKKAQDILSERKYRQNPDTIKFTSIVDLPHIVLAKANALQLSDHVYRDAWDKDKTQFSLPSDTPQMLQSKVNAANISEKVYKQDYETSKKNGYDLRADAIPIRSARASRDIASDYKYKKAHEKQKGHYIGAPTAKDDPKLMWLINAGKLPSDLRYKKDFEKTKTKIQIPADMVSILTAKQVQAAASEIDYRTHLHQWTCHPDQNDCIQAKKAYELQSDNIYKSDLEWIRGCGWMPNESVEVKKVKNAQDILNDRLYRQPASSLKFTSIVDLPSIVLAKTNADQLSAAKYKEAWEQDKRTIHVMPDTPEIMLSRANAVNVSNKLYRDSWDKVKMIYDLRSDAIPIKAAKASREIASDYKYKLSHEKQKGHYIGTTSAQGDNKLAWFLKASKLPSDLLYKKDFEKTKTNVNLPVDMVSIVSAKLCQTLVSDIDYRHYLHQWTCLPDQNDVIQARKAYDLQSDALYKSDLEWLRGVGWMPNDSYDVKKVKFAQDILSERKYRTKPETLNFTPVTDRVDYVSAKQGAEILSDIKYHEAWNGIKTKYTALSDTPLLITAREAAKNVNNKLYKEGWEKVKATGYLLPHDAVQIKHARKSDTVQSELKYKADYIKQRGHYVGVSNADQDPKLRWFKHANFIQNDREYKKLYEKIKSKITIPVDMVSIEAAKQGQSLASDVDYRHYLHQWTCHPDQNDCIQARKAYDLQSDNLYKSDLEWIRGCGWIPLDSVEHQKVRKAQELVNERAYKKDALDSFSKFTPVVDPPSVVLAKLNAVNQSDLKYKETFNAERGQYIGSAETPQLTHSREMSKLASEKLYKDSWDTMKALGYQIPPDYIPIVGAKHARLVSSELKYKENHEKEKGHYLAGGHIDDFPSVGRSLAFQKMRSLLRYKKAYEDNKAKINIPGDMLNNVLAKKCQQILSDIEYRHYLHEWTCLPDERNVIHARKANEILSDNVYKEDLTWLKGIGCYVWDTPEIVRAKKSYDLQSQALYTNAGKENLKNYSVVTDTPVYVTAVQSTINASDLKYKEDFHKTKDKYTTVLETVDYNRTQNLKDLFSHNLYKQAWDSIKATSYQLPADTVALAFAKQNKHIASHLKYREEYEKFKALYTLPRGIQDDPNMARCLRVGKLPLDRLYRDVYEKNKAKIHIAPDMMEIIAARETQDKVSEIDYRKRLHEWICLPDLQTYVHARKVNDQLSDIVYKDDLNWLKGLGCFVWDTPEILHAKHAYNLRSDFIYKAKAEEMKKTYSSVMETPVYVQAKASGKQSSDVIYHSDYEHNVKGKVTSSTTSIDLDRARNANKIQSVNLYREDGVNYLPKGYSLPNDTPLIKLAKNAQAIGSDLKYKELYEHVKAKSYTLGPDNVNFQNIRKVNKVLNERLYRQLYHKQKDKIHTTPDTPEIRQVKATQEAISDLVYKSDFHKLQGHLISMPYTPQTIHCRYVGEITSDNKYKEDLQWLKGLGCFLYDTPDMVRSRELRKLWSHYLYTTPAKKMLDKYSVVLDTPEYRTVQELKTHLSQFVYRAEGNKQKSIYTTVLNTPDFVRAKKGMEIQSQYLYGEVASKLRPIHHADGQTQSLKLAKHVKELVSEKKYKAQYEKLKHKYTPIADTPIILRAKKAYLNASDLRYKETFENAKGKYHTVKDALDIVYHRKVTDDISAVKYKEKYVSELGNWRSIPDRPEYYHHRAVTDSVSDSKYKEDLTWLKGIGCYAWDTPDFTLAEQNKSLYSNYKYKEFSQKTKSIFKYTADTPLFNHFKYATQLQNEKLYKADYEKWKTHYSVVVDDPRHLLAKNASEQISQWKYKKNYEKLKDKYTSVLDTPENQRAHKANKQISDIVYKMEHNKNKAKGYTSIHDTPMLLHVRKVKDKVSDLKYKELYEKSRGHCTMVTDAVQIKTAKEAYKSISNLDYKKKYEKTKAQWQWTVDRPDFMQNAKASLQQSDYEYKLDREFLRGCKLSVTDDKNTVLALKNAEMNSNVKYKKRYEKGTYVGEFGVVADTPQIIHSKSMNTLVSENKYKEEGKKMLPHGAYTKLPDTRDTTHVKEVTKIVSDTQYKEKFKKDKGKSNYANMQEPPEVKHAMDVAKVQSNVAYRKEAKAHLNYTSIADRPDIQKATQVAKLVSDIQYKAKARAEQGRGISIVGRPDIELAQEVSKLTSQAEYTKGKMWGHGAASYDTPIMRTLKKANELTSNVKYKENFSKDKAKRPQYDLKEAQIYQTFKDANTLASEVKYKADLKKLHKPVTDMAESLNMQHITSTSKLSSDYRYKKEYEKNKGHYQLITDNLEQVHVKEATDLQSQVKYKEKYEKERGKAMLDFETPTYVTAKESQHMQSEKEYKKDLEECIKGRNLTGLEVTPSLLHVRHATKIASEKEYRKDLDDTRGRGITILEETPEFLRAKNATQILNEKEYKKTLELEIKGRGLSTLVMETPDFMRAKNATDIASQVKYKQSAEMEKANYTSVVDTPEIIHAQQVKNLSSQKKYKEEAERTMSYYVPVYDTPEMQRVRENQKNFSTLQYQGDHKQSKGKVTVVKDTPEILRVKENQKNFSSILYKEEIGKGTAIGQTPEMERIKRTQDAISTIKYKESIGKGTPISDLPEVKRVKETQKNISSVLYSDSFRKQIQGRAAFVLDTPEMRRVRESQRHISSVKYHEDFEKQKGSFTPVVTDPITERVKKNMIDFSDINYRGIQRKVVEMERKRSEQDQDVTDLRVWRTNPGSVFDYDPAEDNIQSRSLHMLSVQARRSREHSRSASALSLSAGDEKSESEVADHHHSYYSNGGIFTTTTVTGHKESAQVLFYQAGYKQAKTTELPQQRSSSVATQQTTASSVPSHPSTTGKTFRAMYDYRAADNDEVSFRDGDTIVNVQTIDEGWMYGTVQRTGKTGMLPANYVEAI
ncbi:nebulin isoform X7 [Pelobates cultripes]|uniref:Nebulin isoform X7 n=1 Tax=Pelobates cultripes TaxID=61616 RepID=A0AAD1SLN5_PELCU|nr:nebulin isoform X7 [Pelobates cultripes]